MTWNDVIQYALIVALIVAALADRGAHRQYFRERSTDRAIMLAALRRIEAKLNRPDGTS